MAQGFKGLLKSLTLTCGVVDWSWYSNCFGVCPPFGCTTALHAAATSFSPWGCSLRERGKERPAR